MNKSTLRRADLVMSIFLFLFAAFIFYQSSLMMSRTLNLSNEDYAVWYRSAGLMPMIVSILLGASAISLFFRAWRVGARFDFFTREKVKGFFTSREFRVATFIIGWLAVYIFVLLGPVEKGIKDWLYGIDAYWMITQYLPYFLMTFIYLDTFIMVFSDIKKVRSWVIAGVTSIITAALVTYLFGEVAMIVLP